MRSLFPLAAGILFLVGYDVTCVFTPPREYVSLIMRVREYYHASAVFTLHNADLYNDYGDLSMVYIAHTWSRMLSREGIVTLDVNFHRMPRTLRYDGNSARPLFVVIIRNEEAFNKFSEATRTFKMSFAVWLVLFLFPPEEGERDYCHHPIGNPFSLNLNLEMVVLCPGDNVLREWYSIDGKSTEISKLAMWTKELASPLVLLTNHSFYERRGNFKGRTLRGVYFWHSPLFSVENGKPSGLMGHILSELMEALNFTVEMRAVTKYGMPTDNGNWDGAIGELVAGHADIGICEFGMTALRVTAIDFVIPLLVSRNYLYTKQPDGMVVEWFAYFKSFSLWVWRCVGVVILLTTILICVIYAYSAGSNLTVELVSNSLLAVWGIFCQQSLSEFPRLSSLRVAYFTTFIAAIVVSAAYSAALISNLAAWSHVLPFLSFEELPRDGSYRLTVVRNTVDHEMFSVGSYSRATKSILMPDHTLPNNVEAAFAQVCDNSKLVFYTTRDKAGAVAYAIPCRVSIIDAGRVETLSMILQKDSQYRDLINHSVLKLMFNGIMNRVKKPKFKVQNDEPIAFDPVTIYSVAPVLTIFCFGVILGLVTLFIEKCYFCVVGRIAVGVKRVSL